MDSLPNTIILNAIATAALLDNMAVAIQNHLDQRQIENPLMVGIHTGGAWIAQPLHHQLGLTTPLGKLDISFYRDDFSKIGINPQVKPSQLPTTLDGQHILLVDDVLYTGRTIRAALNELFDYGRPASITLIVLIDRDGRELPIQADIV
ncbi:MAG: pyrRH, partial [Halothiobacillaceae bacterium]